MAFSSTITASDNTSSKIVKYGTYTNADSSTGGNIDTGLASCETMLLQPTGSAVIASMPSVYETLPVAGNAVTIVNTANEDGYWIAWGY